LIKSPDVDDTAEFRLVVPAETLAYGNAEGGVDDRQKD